MVVLSIGLGIFAALVLGYSARQREELTDLGDKVGYLLVENQKLREGDPDKGCERCDELLLENARLVESNRSHEFTLNMLLAEMEGKA